MRTLSFDQWEFDSPEGEEGLEIAIASRARHTYPDVPAFASTVWGAAAAGSLPSPVPFAEDIGPGNVRAYLQRYAALVLPAPCDWPAYIASNDWNDFDAILAGPAVFVRYHWWTTA